MTEYRTPECVSSPNKLYVHEVPFYRVDNDDFVHKYVTQVRALQTVSDLKQHIRDWYPLFSLKASWAVAGHVSLARVLCLDITDKVLEAVRKYSAPNRAFPCTGLDEDTRVAAEILVPCALLISIHVAQRLCVPVGTALHQVFCTRTDHEPCF